MGKEMFQTLSITLMILISIITTISNSLCIAVIVRSRKLLKRPSTFFILNLLAVHLIQGSVVFPFYAAKKAKVSSPHWSQVICDGFRFTYMVTFYAAIMSVLLIGVDRLIATCRPFKYKEIVSKKKVNTSICIMWLYVIGLCLIPFKELHNEADTIDTVAQPSLGTNTTTNTEVNWNGTLKKVNKYVCYYEQKTMWTILMLILNCALPYLAIVVIYQQVMSHVNLIQNGPERVRSDTDTSIINVRLNKSRESTWKMREQKQYQALTRLAFIMGISYFFFWLPSVIYYTLLVACKDRCFPRDYDNSLTEKYVGFFMKYLAFADAVAAPIIYCAISGEFRKHISWNQSTQRTTIAEKTYSKTHNYKV